MERRSGRGRQEVAKVATPVANSVKRGNVGGSKSEPRGSVQVVTTPANNTTSAIIPASDVPVVGNEEIVLNRRGMPARQRKRNRLYFDDDMITPDKWGASIARNAKKVKAEPVDVTDDDGEDEDDEIIGSFSDASSGRHNSRGKASSASPSPSKTPTRKPPAAESSSAQDKTGKKGKNVSIDKTPVPQRGRQPTLQLLTASPEKEKDKRTGRGVKSSVPTSRPVTSKPPAAKVKTDPDEIPESRSKRNDIDKWGKLVQRTNKLRRDREERESDKRNQSSVSPERSNVRNSRDLNHSLLDDDLSSDEFTKSPRKETERQQEKERERLLKEKKHAILKEKEQERIAKERLLKDKEKKILQKEKEKKRDNRDPITVIPPVVKLTPNRATFITTEEQHHALQQQVPQQLMAVIKIDDTSTQVIDKRVAHDISIRLRNLLKLPKAHKWVCYEWFYSNIDKVLFEGENDFQICLKESFPTLKARKLTRTEWTKIRRLMGKPRRCSQAFFDEEREELARRRSKIRQIQQRKVTDFNYKELPDEIPLQLVIGTKVTARLRRPQDGLFTGTIEGVDTSNNTYRITFDRPGLGTHSIPDYEVLSNDTPETVSTSSFALKIPRRSGGFTVGTFKFQNPALLGDQPEGFPKSPFPADGMLGGFPIRLLDMIVRLSKLLKAKREKIMSLKELNVEAEKMKSYGRPYNSEYRTRYARCVLDLDSMNKEMAMYLEGIQTYCLEITNDHGTSSQMVIPEHILDSSRQEASMVVSTYNCKANRTLVHNQKIVGLVHHLTSLLLQVRALSSSDRNLYELKSLKDTIRDVKATLEGKNLQCFQNKIEIPMNRIIAGLCVSNPKSY